MRRIGRLALFVLAGLASRWALSLDVHALAHSPGYKLGAYLLLAIGLYSATYGIDLALARSDKKAIGSAVTIGVIVKRCSSVSALRWPGTTRCS